MAGSRVTAGLESKEIMPSRSALSSADKADSGSPSSIKSLCLLTGSGTGRPTGSPTPP
eukprot:CAMPEP_0175845972 /NCGR_PEP_ID=MMETSP0107_2-20121207/22525_1 /TAXON_ID=195067 ORGANISM="Goniomonas pacifica, Strain CCMP1869" /NCGR_SAMPLE_ID=MMETSP0107_2 /ASSEMBLY_ACC=CAM_ASM_000203 /LENGTH=57 /DNA_ID=CAMNT_0017160597 /DNA_START=862 /DNA_END=1032 /DNA_ORIENTATION=-